MCHQARLMDRGQAAGTVLSTNSLLQWAIKVLNGLEINHWKMEWDFHHHLAVCYLDYYVHLSDILEMKICVCAHKQRLKKNAEITYFHTF